MIFAVLEDWYHHIVLTHSYKLISFFYIYCSKQLYYDFCFPKTSVATVLRWGWQSYSQFGFFVILRAKKKLLKLATVSRSYKNYSGTVFLGHDVFIIRMAW